MNGTKASGPPRGFLYIEAFSLNKPSTGLSTRNPTTVVVAMTETVVVAMSATMVMTVTVGAVGAVDVKDGFQMVVDVSRSNTQTEVVDVIHLKSKHIKREACGS